MTNRAQIHAIVSAIADDIVHRVWDMIDAGEETITIQGETGLSLKQINACFDVHYEGAVSYAAEKRSERFLG